MEENSKNDRLEEFLRKNLDGHSEDPPGDLWSKIAPNLEPPTLVPSATVPKVRALQRWWAVAAAVVVLFVAQHFYFNNKIQQLSRELEQNSAQLEQMEQQKLIDGTAPTATNPAPTEVEESIMSQQPSTLNSLINGAGQANGSSPNFSRNAGTVANEGTIITKEKKRKNATEAQQITPKQPNDVVNELAGSQQEKAETLPSDVAQDPAPKPAESDQLAANERADLQKVWLKRIALEPATKPTPLVKALPIIDPLQNNNRFVVGMNVMPMVSKSKVQEFRPPPPPGGGPGGGPGEDERKSFELKEETSKLAWMAGVSVEAEVAPRLRLGTGVNYRTVEYETTHAICLDFRDRKHGPGPPGNEHEHDFQYDLNTAVGTVEMEVRAESSESAQNIPDDEKLEANITTNQRFAYISVPIYANYTLGKGRLRALAKGGVMLNFLQDNDFQVGQIKSLNDRFDFMPRKEQKGSPNDLQSVTVDYLAGLGLEYRLTKATSLRIEPTVIGSLTSVHNNPRIESSEFSAGLNLGLTYSF